MYDLLARLKDRLPAPVTALLERLKALPRGARIAIGVTLVVAVPLVAWTAARGSPGSYAVLFANLEQEDAAAIVSKLREKKVEYHLEADGTTIAVPEAQARELRLELAAAGLPRGGGVGFEAFDKNRFGATEFEQRVLFRRALEGELSRTIHTLSAVESARVHLVLPERSVFLNRGEAASASVVVKLRPGRALGAPEVNSVVHLVAASVPGLAAERVALVTTQGAVLHRPRKPGEEALSALADEHLAAARALEATLEDRARAMLEKVVGPGHADVRVSVELDLARVERSEDHYDPKQSALRSEEKSSERTQGDITPASVPGAESNLPGAAPKPVGGPSPESVMRESRTQNFEVDRVSEKRIVPGGAVRRLTVAAVLDDGGRKRAHVDSARMTALVRSAVGADERRGDVVTVDVMPFSGDSIDASPGVDAVQVPSARVPSARVQAAILAIAGAVFLVGALVARRRRRERAKRTLDEPAPETERDTEGVLAEHATEDSNDEDALDPETLRAAAQEKVLADPATAALVVRYWLGRPGAPAGERSDDDHAEPLQRAA